MSSRNLFETAYETGRPPWDINGPQPVVEAQEAQGAIGPDVLDAGCGTGENALFLASKGHQVWGLDFIPSAIEQAQARASARNLNVHFEVGNALELAQFPRTFDTVVDCGLFHSFAVEERPRYVAGLAHVVRPGGHAQILCFSDREPPGLGPHRVSQDEIREAFPGKEWTLESIREVRYRSADTPETRTFTPGGAIAWHVIVRRNDS